MKILICGDSYCVTDSNYPGLHWSEKILQTSPTFTVSNLAYGGASNAHICLQLSHGIKFINPDFVIISFTGYTRYEVDKDQTVKLNGFTVEDINNYYYSRYQTSLYENEGKNKIINQYISNAASDSFEKIKNYFYISLALHKLYISKIPFCFTLGGFVYNHDYLKFINSNYLDNILNNYEKNQLTTNLWFHGQKNSPYFHVDDENIQNLFAAECLMHIEKLKNE